MAEERSKVLPSHPFDIALSNLMGHPNGAHTPLAAVQAIDPYGNVTQYLMQTVRWAEGNSVFITQISSAEPIRIILPPKVLATLLRQLETVATIVRRRHGRRLAEERKAAGITPSFTPAMRAKALKTRKANAAKRRQRSSK
jgi:hypothetical protein